MDFKESLEQDKVSQLPIRSPVTVRMGTIAREAVSRMRESQLGCAVVVDSQNRPMGIFTERSLIYILAQGDSIDDYNVEDAPDLDFRIVKQSDPCLGVWDAIQREQYRFLCVVDDDGQLIGLTGQRGMAEYVSDCFPWQVAVQRLGAKPWDEKREGA